jgi:hypothetical protein
MASTTPRLPEQFEPRNLGPDDFHVNEIAADQAGPASPYGRDTEFPWPVEKLRYTHPSPADRPHLANGR